MCANKGFNVLPGVKPDSTLNHIFNALINGKVLTSLDGLLQSKTMYLGKYVSILRNKYGIPVRDEWIEIEHNDGSPNKRVKRYWIDTK